MNSKRFYDASKVSDHHAIIPTERRPGAMTADEEALYDLVVRSLIAAHYPDYAYESTRLRVVVERPRIPRRRGRADGHGLARRACAGGEKGGHAPAGRARGRNARGAEGQRPQKADQAPGKAQRRLAALPDGARRAGTGGRGTARAHEVLRPRHARHPRRHHRAAHRGGAGRARGQEHRLHGEGPQADRRRPGADRLRRHHRQVGKGAQRHGRQPGRRPARPEARRAFCWASAASPSSWWTRRKRPRRTCASSARSQGRRSAPRRARRRPAAAARPESACRPQAFRAKRSVPAPKGGERGR